MSEQAQRSDWQCGGWEEAALNTLRAGAALSLYEKLLWLDEMEEMFLFIQERRSKGAGDEIDEQTTKNDS